MGIECCGRLSLPIHSDLIPEIFITPHCCDTKRSVDQTKRLGFCRIPTLSLHGHTFVIILRETGSRSILVTAKIGTRQKRRGSGIYLPTTLGKLAWTMARLIIIVSVGPEAREPAAVRESGMSVPDGSPREGRGARVPSGRVIYAPLSIPCQTAVTNGAAVSGLSTSRIDVRDRRAGGPLAPRAPPPPPF